MNSTIGARLRQARKERDLTQEQLAHRAGVSRVLVSKLEQGQRESARISSLGRLANALGISLSDLLGRRERFGPAPDTGLLAVRDILLSVADLPGLGDAIGDSEPSPMAALTSSASSAWDLYWTGRFGELAAVLPGLVGEIRGSRDAATWQPASRLLAQAYQMCANILVHTGHDDLAAVAANRAAAAALDGGDELQHAVMCGVASWVFLHMARLEDAERIAREAAARIEPSMSAPLPHLTVWGALLLTAAAPAAAADKAAEVREYLSLSRAAAARLEHGDRHDYWVSFGPTQVAMQAAHAYAVLGRPGEALKAAQGVRRADLLRISWGAHQLDVATAWADAGRDDAAIAALTEACSVSAEWFGHQGAARALVRDLRQRQHHRPQALQRLVSVVGPD